MPLTDENMVKFGLGLLHKIRFTDFYREKKGLEPLVEVKSNPSFKTNLMSLLSHSDPRIRRDAVMVLVLTYDADEELETKYNSMIKSEPN